MEKLRGATSQIALVRIVDSNGLPKTGLVYNTTGLSAAFIRELDTAVTDISLASTTKGVWTSGGFVEIDATKFPGSYEIGIPNAAIGTGDVSTWCELQIVGTLAANLYAQPLRIDLVAVNMQDSVRAGLRALPNADAEAAGGLYTRGTGAGQINQPANGVIDANEKTINGVSTSSVTAVNANIGSTQPVNFTGTGASALAKTDVIDIASAAVSTSTAQIGVNAVNIGGTAQTGRDIGASVLLSSGTGTGQLDFTSGVVKANLVQILATALTETAGQIAAGFKKWFNVAVPTSTMNEITLVDTITNLTNNTPTIGDVTLAASQPNYAPLLASSYTTPDNTGINSAASSAATAATQATAANGKLPALVGGRIDASVGAYQTGQAPLQPTVADRTLDVTSTGEAGIDWANVGSPTATVNLSATTIKTVTDAVTVGDVTLAATQPHYDVATITNQNAIISAVAVVQSDTDNIQTRLPAALVTGRMDASVGAVATGVVAADVLDAVAADYNTPGTIGAAINGGGSTGPTLQEIIDGVWNALNVDYAMAGSQSEFIAAILSKLNTIGSGKVIINQPVDPRTGITTVVAGSSYMISDGRSLIYTFDGWPNLVIDEPAYWNARGSVGRVEQITGKVIAVNQVQFELTAAQSQSLVTGSYSLSADSSNENLLKTPNATLIVMQSN